MIAMSLSGIMRDLGYVGLFALMVGETVFPPIPSEAVLPLAGYLAERGEFSVLLVFLVSTLGSVAGAQVLYEGARHGGAPFAARFLRFARQPPERLEEAEAWFARRGAAVVFFGRCVPGVRSVVSLPAGVLKMPRARYVAFTAAGSALWNALLIGAGFVLGTQWERVSELVGAVSLPLLVAGTALVSFLLGRAVVRRRRSAG